MKRLLATLAILCLGASFGSAQASCEIPGNLDHIPDLPRFGRLQLERGLCNRLASTLLAAQHQLSSTSTDAQRARVTGDLARRLHGFGFDEQALELFRVTWSLTPESFQAPFMLSLIEREGDGDRTREYAEAAFAIRPEHPPLQAFLARLRFEEGDLEAAQRLAKRALGAEPELAYARWTLAEIAAARGDQEAVLLHTSKALEASPEADRLHALRATALRRLNRSAEAEEEAKLAGPRAPDLTGPWIATLGEIQFNPLSDKRFGMATLRRGQYTVAQEALERAHASDPSDSEVLVQLGRCRRFMGERRAATRTLRLAVKLDGRYGTWTELAHALQEAGDIHQASAAYRRALEHRPGDKMARFWLAEALVGEDNLPSALALVEQLLIEGFGPSGYVLASNIASRLGLENRALEFLSAGMLRFPSDVELAAALRKTDGAS